MLRKHPFSVWSLGSTCVLACKPTSQVSAQKSARPRIASQNDGIPIPSISNRNAVSDANLFIFSRSRRQLVNSTHCRTENRFLHVALFIFPVSAPNFDDLAARNGLLGNLCVSVVSRAPRFRAAIPADRALIRTRQLRPVSGRNFDPIPVQTLTSEISSGTSVLLLGGLTVSFLAGCCVHFRQGNFFSTFMRQVIFTSLT